MMSENKVKIGVLSDTHISGFDRNLKNIIDEHFADVDLIFHAGDLIDLCVLDLFGGKEVRAVYGNMDSHRVRQELPEQLLMEIQGFKIALIHGWGAPSGIERKLADKVGKQDCIVFGHTHYPVNKKIDGVLFFNPGSAVDKRFASSRSIGILEVGEEITGRIITIK
jgi:uncharacterized protein